ncbi:hypothetical protein [Paenibacillus sp. HB172176]|uniref:hypothetical protein n=1 Tax=Paenibacillus sp. HB172176 TaxID=2493690 RepID=UPI00143B7AB9|nr:hypothetical protein [Paenibacillus sp. HB172176]
MSTIEIQAAFPSEYAAQEALHKLQSLRVIEVGGLLEHGRLNATVDKALSERAVRLIEQIGGQASVEALF